MVKVAVLSMCVTEARKMASNSTGSTRKEVHVGLVGLKVK